MEGDFQRLVDAAARGKDLGKDALATLDAIIEGYPWFTTARLLREAAGGRGDVSLRLHLEAFPRPSVMLREVVLERVDDPIERFLSLGDYRIIPADGATDENAAEASGTFVSTGDTATEELAEIYLAQGLVDEAKKIYEQLSLQNPKKSI